MTTPETPSPARTVAAIDIGSNSLRLIVAQVLSNGRVEVLERLQRALRLGQDTFTRLRFSAATMRAAVAVLRDFRRIIDSYQVEKVRAVATSAVREAANADTFLDRIFMATGLDVVIIDTAEETRLTVSAVREAAGSALLAKRKNALVADVGGGSTLLTMLEGGDIAVSQSLPLGSIRLQEVLATSYDPPARAAEVLRQQIASEIAGLQATLPLKRATMLIGVGSDARLAAERAGKRLVSTALTTVRASALNELVDQCRRHTPDELARLFDLPAIDAETLTPALLVYQALLEATQARTLTVADVSMRDGLLLDLARSVTGQEDQTLTEGILHAALAVAEKYRADPEHARCVTDIAVRLFDELQSEHGLSRRHRLLLQAAAIMHEVGSFISTRSHHKHSMYLIANAEIFGLTREERTLVALLARYHRHAAPKATHPEYMTLPRQERMIVSKLAALLRVADALDDSHTQQVRDIGFRRQDEELTIYVPTAADLTLERKAMAVKADLFEDIYGLKVRLEETQPPV